MRVSVHGGEVDGRATPVSARVPPDRSRPPDRLAAAARSGECHALAEILCMVVRERGAAGRVRTPWAVDDTDAAETGVDPLAADCAPARPLELAG